MMVTARRPPCPGFYSLYGESFLNRDPWRENTGLCGSCGNPQAAASETNVHTIAKFTMMRESGFLWLGDDALRDGSLWPIVA